MTIEEYNVSVDNFSDAVYRFLLKNAKDEDKVKDLMQETYEKLWLKRFQRNPNSNFKFRYPIVLKFTDLNILGEL